MPARPPAWLRRSSLIGLALVLAACVSNHDDFKKVPTSNAGAGGKSGAAGSGSGGGGHGGADAGVDTGVDSGPPEPTGPNVLTIVNGVVDAPSLAVCFAKLADGGAVEPFGSPLTSAPLAYGGSLALSALSGADFASDTLVPLLLAGELERVATLDCAAAVALAEQTESAFNADAGADDAGIGAAGAGAQDAGNVDASVTDAGGGSGGADSGLATGTAHSPLRVRALPALPAGTLAGDLSYLLVASGCLGGLGFDSGNTELLCGDGYTPTNPTLFPVVVTLSRITQADRVGMQVVHASRASGSVSVSIASQPPGTTVFTLVKSITDGQVLPKPPNFAHSEDDYALSNQIELAGSASAVGETIGDATSRGGSGLLSNGASYALILIGPRFDYGLPPPLWNAAAATIVTTSPMP
ncbi:MAG TPA: hypothetical protein VGI10_21515 [Polyangiaceae bacterium]